MDPQRVLITLTGLQGRETGSADGPALSTVEDDAPSAGAIATAVKPPRGTDAVCLVSREREEGYTDIEHQRRKPTTGSLFLAHPNLGFVCAQA